MHEYTATTTNATNVITATPLHEEHEILVWVNDEPHENGTAATWVVGENDVVIHVDGRSAYYVTVTKTE